MNSFLDFSIDPKNTFISLAFEDYQEPLSASLIRSGFRHKHFGRLFVFEVPTQKLKDPGDPFKVVPKDIVAWSQSLWTDLSIHTFGSITEAQRILKQQKGFWSGFHLDHHRRAQLIQDGLPTLKNKPFELNFETKTRVIHHWVLFEKNKFLTAQKSDSQFPCGEISIAPDPASPSRAYNKLREGLVFFAQAPKINEKCLEVGSAPGGWTQTLVSLGCRVDSVDRSELDVSLRENALIRHKIGDAFNATPEAMGPVDWLLSDLACYPEKLFEFVFEWIQSKKVKFVFATIKLQKDTSLDVVQKFYELKGSSVKHLMNNKNELTFFWSHLK